MKRKRPKLEWKRGHRGKTKNMIWSSRCGRYTVRESARYEDIEFPTVHYKAWFDGSVPVTAKGWSATKRIETTIVHFRTKAAAIAACDKHARTPRRNKKAS